MMLCNIINGQKISSEINKNIEKIIKIIKKKYNIYPNIQIILVGNNPASILYTAKKIKIANQLGISAKLIKFSENISENELINTIIAINNNTDIHGAIVQLPLPIHINKDKILNLIDAKKDIDGLCLKNRQNLNNSNKIPYTLNCLYEKNAIHNILQICQNKNFFFIPCTPLGCLYLIQKTLNITLNNKNITVFGQSNLVGAPLSKLLELNDANLIRIDRKTPRHKEQTYNADILVLAVGMENLLDSTMTNKNKKKIIIDIGINQTLNGITGDCNFASFHKDINCYITPVPKGVGPMTVTSLMFNSLLASIINKNS